MPINVASATESVYTEQEVDAKLADLTTVAGYQKPTGGIPKSDLAASVQASLDKADSALQVRNVVVLETKAAYDALTPKDPAVVYVWKV